MKTVLKYLDRFEEFILIPLMGIMATVVFIQVIARLSGSSLPWSEEFSRYLTAWITFVGASLGVKRGAHIGVEAFTLLLPKKLRLAVNFLGILLCMVFCYVGIKYGIAIVLKQLANGQISPAMRIPMYLPYLAMPCGFVLCGLRYIQAVVRTWKKFKAADLAEAELKQTGGVII